MKALTVPCSGSFVNLCEDGHLGADSQSRSPVFLTELRLMSEASSSNNRERLN